MPENVTLLPKTTAQTNGGGDWSEHLVVAKKGETVGSILRELGAAPDEIKTILAVLGAGGRRRRHQGRPEAARADGAAGRSAISSRCASSSPATARIEAAVALSDTGKYVPVDIRNVDTEAAEASDDEQATTTAAACGSIRASTRPRCATTCRNR